MQRHFHVNTSFEPNDLSYGPTNHPEESECDMTLSCRESEYLQEYLQELPDEQDMAQLSEQVHSELIESVVNFVD